MKRIAVVIGLLPLLGGCDQIKERMGLHDPAKVEAEGNAIGSACRHAGRGLEDCYRLNEDANKASIYAGWKEMNEYMLKNNMQAVPPQIPAEGEEAGHAGKKASAEDAHADAAPAGKTDKTEKAAEAEKADKTGKTAEGHAPAAKVEKAAEAGHGKPEKEAKKTAGH